MDVKQFLPLKIFYLRYRVVFDNCEDHSYEIFTFWLSNTRESFDTIIMLDTKNDEVTKEKHVILFYLYIVDPLYNVKSWANYIT